MTPPIELSKEKIAIIGMSCRFPGGADTPELFWKLLDSKIDAITEIPKERWNISNYYDVDREAAGKMYIRNGGFLENIDKFDAQFFNISPVEAECIDPQIRLLLELSYEALEDSKINIDTLNNSKTGVFIGIINNDYILKSVHSHNLSLINPYSLTGTAFASASGRISFAYGFKGPSISIDTACSSSLVAIHYACQSLLSGESNMTMAGGANLILSPELHVVFSKLGALSSDGRCKAFDESANGFVRSEGGALVVLKRYEDAIRDNDNIYAVISGSAITNDGKSKTYTMPNPEAQSEALRSALANAGYRANQISYIEAHGTGTPVGDPIEIQAIADVLNEDPASHEVIIGSVKTNIGHTESASGVAGLIKAVLALKKEKIPANLHFKKANPKINFEGKARLKVPISHIPWKRGAEKRIAGINSFGISGTNVHLLVEEAELELHRVAIPHNKETKNKICLLPVSAKSIASLESSLIQYQEIINNTFHLSFESVCKTLAVRKPQFDYRILIIANSREECLQKLERELMLKSFKELKSQKEEKKIAFVFPGQGSQWIGMGKDLYEKQAVFRKHLQECDHEISKYTSWSVLDELFKDEQTSQFHNVDVIQPLIFALQVSLARLWQHWGIKPSVVVGHSMGEVAASCVAEAISLSDAALIICKRSALAKQISGKGAMAIVELSMKEAESIINPFHNRVSIAASNSPASTILSGDEDCVKELVKDLEAKNIFCRLINVDYASHSHHIEQIRHDLLYEFRSVKPRHASIPIYSTVINSLIDGENMNGEYWVNNIRNPVLFSQVIQNILQDEHTTFIEISPHPVVVPLIEQNAESLGKSPLIINSTKRNVEENDEMTLNLTHLFNHGIPVNWNAYYHDTVSADINLPPYPWSKEGFWLKDEVSVKNYSSQKANVNPLLGDLTKTAFENDLYCWQNSISLDAYPYLKDHAVNGSIIFPAAGYVEWIHAALLETFNSSNHAIVSLELLNPLVLEFGKNYSVTHLLFSHESDKTITFKILTAIDASQSDWVIHCKGKVNLHLESFETMPADLKALKMRCSVALSKSEHYRLATKLGILYGEKFQNLQEVWVGENEALGIVKNQDLSNSNYNFHPGLLDACFQVALATLPKAEIQNNNAFLPSFIKQIKINSIGTDRRQEFLVHVQKVNDCLDSFERMISIYDDQQQLVAVFHDFTFKRLENSKENIDLDKWIHSVSWKKYAPSYNVKGLAEKTVVVVVPDEYITHLLRSVLHSVGGITSVIFLTMKKSSTEKEMTELLSAIPVAHPVTVLFVGERPQVHSEFLLENITESCYGLSVFIKVMTRLSFKTLPQLITVSYNCQCIDDTTINLMQTPFWGLGKLLFHEHHEFKNIRIDLSESPDLNEIQSLVNISLFEKTENDFVLRGNRCYIPRLESGVSEKAFPEQRVFSTASHPNYVATTSQPGELENIYFQEVKCPALKEDEIEVEVKATGLNFMNVMSALGIYPGYENGFRSLGLEFAGIISSVGNKVKGYKAGDRIMGAAENCLAGIAITHQNLITHIPSEISFEDAASCPVAFSTAYYAMVIKGGLKKHERILIHAATGGVGLAAIQIAQEIGAEIYATAGSEEKRALLTSLGVKHVFNSRDASFAEDVLKASEGEGVDVVLNSLTGESMVKSIELLRDFGRFLEIGKKDVYTNNKLGLTLFKRNISYFFIDLDALIRGKSKTIREVLSKVAKKFEKRKYAPIRKTVFPFSRVTEGYRYMASRKHIGKVVFSAQDNSEITIRPINRFDLQFGRDETYLITGGLGAMGLSLAQWMSERGAGNIILMSRSKPTRHHKTQFQRMEENGTNIVIKNIDVANRTAVRLVFDEVKQSGSSLKGIVHAAGLLSDGTLINMTKEKFNEVFRAKICGAWNLHQLSLDMDLDFFVLYSSVASMLGSVGQANYVAANSFLDGLAVYRNSQKLRSVGLNWGPIASQGLAAVSEIRGKRLEQEGFKSITLIQHIDLFQKAVALNSPETNRLLFSLNLTQWTESNPSYLKDSLLFHLIKDDSQNNIQNKAKTGIVQKLFEIESEEDRLLEIETILRQLLAGILKYAVEKIDNEVPFSKQGLDSLMAVQFRNKIERLFNVNISVTVFWNYPKIKLLASFLLKELGLEIREELINPEQPNEQMDLLNLSIEELNMQLTQELRNINIS